MWWSHYNTWLICKLVFGALEGGLSTWLHRGLCERNVVSGKELDFSEECEREKAERNQATLLPSDIPHTARDLFPHGGCRKLRPGMLLLTHQQSVPDSSRPVRTLAHDMNIISGPILLLWELLLAAFFFTSWISSKSIHSAGGSAQSREVFPSSDCELGQTNRPKCQSRPLLGNKMCCLGQNSEAQSGKTIHLIKLNL